VRNFFVKSISLVFVGLSVVAFAKVAAADNYSDRAHLSYEQEKQQRVLQEYAEINKSNTAFVRTVRQVAARMHQKITSLLCYNSYGYDESRTQWCDAAGSCVTVALNSGGFTWYPIDLAYRIAAAAGQHAPPKIELCHFDLSNGLACGLNGNADEGSLDCRDSSGKTVVDQHIGGDHKSDDGSVSDAETSHPRTSATSSPPSRR
jgi:hypothetical protein